MKAVSSSTRLPLEPPRSARSPERWVEIEAWAHLSWLWAAFSTRSSGASAAYGSREQNLGWTPEDNPLHVAENRRKFLQDVTGNPVCRLVTLKQIHSGIVHDLVLDGTDVTGPHDFSSASVPTLQGDGLISGEPGQVLGILTADCVPVLVADTRTHRVAAFHAGWRGTLARIVENGVRSLRERHGCRPEDLVAAIGPSVRPCCFEVGAEIQAVFTENFPCASTLFVTPQPGSRPRLDLQEANRRQLLDAGLRASAIQTIAECTSCHRTSEGRRKYFSYRAEAGVTGRMLSIIGTDPECLGPHASNGAIPNVPGEPEP